MSRMLQARLLICSRTGRHDALQHRILQMVTSSTGIISETTKMMLSGPTTSSMGVKAAH